MRTLNILFALAILITPTFAMHQSVYTDSILWVYNSTVIETANWEFVYLNNTVLDMDHKDKYIGRDIFVFEIRGIGDNAVLADIAG